MSQEGIYTDARNQYKLVHWVMVHVAEPDFRKMCIKAGRKTPPLVALVTLCPRPRVTVTAMSTISD